MTTFPIRPARRGRRCASSARGRCPQGTRMRTRSSGLRPKMPRRPSRFGARTVTSWRPARSAASIVVPAAACAGASSPRPGETSTSTRGSSHVSIETSPPGISTTRRRVRECRRTAWRSHALEAGRGRTAASRCAPRGVGGGGGAPPGRDRGGRRGRTRTWLLLRMVDRRCVSMSQAKPGEAGCGYDYGRRTVIGASGPSGVDRSTIALASPAVDDPGVGGPGQPRARPRPRC